MSFPSKAEESALHKRLVEHDPVAPEDAFRTLMEPLTKLLRNDLKCSEDDAHDSAIDALLAYLANPAIYNASRARLATFLADIAKKRAIDRLRASKSRRRREEKHGTLLALRNYDPKEDAERGLDAERLWREIKRTVPDARDREVLRLIVNGERSTKALAEALGIGTLPAPELKRTVKRHRDRLMGTLKRLGDRLNK